MNILFLTIGSFKDIEARSLYTDLLRCFRDHGHKIYSVSPYERRIAKETECRGGDGCCSLYVKTGNLTKCGRIEKGISTFFIERDFERAIKKFYSHVRFDLVLYSTPPITFANVVSFIKHRDHAVTYLILKDIFPQNAVDLRMLSKTGWKGIVYRYFRRKEKQL